MNVFRAVALCGGILLVILGIWGLKTRNFLHGVFCLLVATGAFAWFLLMVFTPQTAQVSRSPEQSANVAADLAQLPESQGRDANAAENVESVEYNTLLSMVVARVEKEEPAETLRSDLIHPLLRYKLEKDGPFLLLSNDLIKVENDKVTGIMHGLGLQTIKDFLGNDRTMQQNQYDGFTVLNNFPVFPNNEHPLESSFFDLIRKHRNPAVRVGAILALRNDSFNQGLVCTFLSKLLRERDENTQYAALLALADYDYDSDSAFNPLLSKTYYFSTDDVLSNIDSLMRQGFQVKMDLPIARILSRDQYIHHAMVHKLSRGLRHLMPEDPDEKEFYTMCLERIDAMK